MYVPNKCTFETSGVFKIHSKSLLCIKVSEIAGLFKVLINSDIFSTALTTFILGKSALLITFTVTIDKWISYD